MTQEEIRLDEEKKREKNWKRWGPYLSERQWSTVREDYSWNGDSWNYFPESHARSRAYRWGEDGLLGITDRECRLCFAPALWNGKDPYLKERLFGLTSDQGNHGEDVKEYYFYLDSTPTHSYMSALYKYPQREFPYQKLLETNQKRGLNEREFELFDTGIFSENRYFDLFVEYAKNTPDDLLIRFTLTNQSKEPASLHFLPQLWFRNTWSWGEIFENVREIPTLKLLSKGLVEVKHETLGHFFLSYEPTHGIEPFPLFTENLTHSKKLFGQENISPYVKDAFHRYIVEEEKAAINPENKGTKFAVYYPLYFQGNESITLRLRLSSQQESPSNAFLGFDEIVKQRKSECDDFYEKKIPSILSPDEKKVCRQAYAGLNWSKQFYHYIVKDWLKGDPLQPKPPTSRNEGRNKDWKHFFSRDVLSVPDKWEYPWFASWDTAFHMIPFAKIDPDYAKKLMILFLREWYMHPNGELPAYEFNFSDVNPPVHAWAAWRIYKMTGKRGERDRTFLESVFQKLLLNFTWWLNRKDKEGNHLFAGGFLGLDNIGIFDRSLPFSSSMIFEQADGTAWMAFYCLSMLSIALELACSNHVYEDIASKFFEHFLRIADAINEYGGTGLWDPVDGFYYDRIKLDSRQIPLRVRSIVGLIPLLATEVLEESKIKMLSGFSKRMHWFLNHRHDLENVITYCIYNEKNNLRLLALPSREKLTRILSYLFDESEFLSPFGLRSLSKRHEKNPTIVRIDDHEQCISYEPGESKSRLFGGNSNWRGPIWLPMNFLIIEALERYHHFYGDDLKVEFPTHSGHWMNLKEISEELSQRLCRLFVPDEKGKRPCFGDESRYAEDPNWKDLLLFYEYFHGDTGVGLGASHQTGWTALIAKIVEDRGKNRGKKNG